MRDACRVQKQKKSCEFEVEDLFETLVVRSCMWYTNEKDVMIPWGNQLWNHVTCGKVHKGVCRYVNSIAANQRARAKRKRYGTFHEARKYRLKTGFLGETKDRRTLLYIKKEVFYHFHYIAKRAKKYEIWLALMEAFECHFFSTYSRSDSLPDISPSKFIDIYHALLSARIRHGQLRLRNEGHHSRHQAITNLDEVEYCKDEGRNFVSFLFRG